MPTFRRASPLSPRRPAATRRASWRRSTCASPFGTCALSDAWLLDGAVRWLVDDNDAKDGGDGDRAPLPERACPCRRSSPSSAATAFALASTRAPSCRAASRTDAFALRVSHSCACTTTITGTCARSPPPRQPRVLCAFSPPLTVLTSAAREIGPSSPHAAAERLLLGRRAREALPYLIVRTPRRSPHAHSGPSGGSRVWGGRGGACAPRRAAQRRARRRVRRRRRRRRPRHRRPPCAATTTTTTTRRARGGI